MHASLQFSDSTAQKQADVDKIFKRAKTRKVAWVTGTEGWEKDSYAALKAAAHKYGFLFTMPRQQDSWIAVNKTYISSGYRTGFSGTVVAGMGGQFTKKGIPYVTFHNDKLGTITVFACHLLTKGRPNGDAAHRIHLAQNRALNNKLGVLAQHMGAGRKLAFYGGDQNIVDRETDTFLGAPFLSVWDELHKYPNTGDGNIDVIAKYDRDGRTKAVYAHALNDTLFPLHTDHFLIEAGYDVRVAK